MISVYSDGASGNKKGKPGGYGWVITRGREVLAWGYGGSPSTSNNLMEAEGAIQGLHAAMELGLHQNGELIELVSDSQLTLGFATGANTPTTNLEQVAKLQAVAKEARCRCRWVKGHNGDEFNEMCDQLATLGKRIYTPS